MSQHENVSSGIEAYEAFQEGSRLLASTNPHAAAVALERARDLEPDKGSVREALGRAYFSSGRFTDASAEFARAIELDPVNDYAHFGLGLTLKRLGDDVGARRHLKLAVAMRPLEEYREALARIVEVPITDLPTTDLPITDLPTTDLPTTDLPTTDLPTTDLPTTDAT
ncbi:MAG: tetratricopeptide repeat protein [Acidimicrobiia bacterium]|nr:tetratricopeptide repeat protein [Acidimicrobiia bacterium]